MAISLEISDIVRRAGGYHRLAEAAGVARTTPYRWRRVPAIHAVAVGQLIGVAPYLLRPDVFPTPAGIEHLPQQVAA